MRGLLYALVLALALHGCAGIVELPQAGREPVGDARVRLYDVGDLTTDPLAAADTASCFAGMGCCILFLPSALERVDISAEPVMGGESLIRILRERTGIAARDPRGYLLEMGGPAMLLAVAPESVLDDIDAALALLRSRAVAGRLPRGTGVALRRPL